jgi:hypothetical protein
MELLVHINKRIKNNPRIQLPVEALLLQYQDPAATSFVINFTIIYIKMGFPRLSLERQMELVPSVLAGIEAKPTMHQGWRLFFTKIFEGFDRRTQKTVKFKVVKISYRDVMKTEIFKKKKKLQKLLLFLSLSDIFHMLNYHVDIRYQYAFLFRLFPVFHVPLFWTKHKHRESQLSREICC